MKPPEEPNYDHQVFCRKSIHTWWDFSVWALGIYDRRWMHIIIIWTFRTHWQRSRHVSCEWKCGSLNWNRHGRLDSFGYGSLHYLSSECKDINARCTRALSIWINFGGVYPPLWEDAGYKVKKISVCDFTDLAHGSMDSLLGYLEP